MKTKNNFAALLLLAAGLVIFLLSVAALPPDDMINVPEGYEKICSVNMSEARKDTVVYSFSLDKEKQTDLLIWTNTPAEKQVKLTGPENMLLELFNGKSNINQVGAKLGAGKYEIIVTNPADKGEMLIYSKK